MKILLLSCHTGDGHNAAAAALLEAFQGNGDNCELVDALSFCRPVSNRMVTSSYNSIIVKKPDAFGWIYKVGSLYSSTGLASPVYLANKLYARKLLSYITEQNFDAVICTHLFPMEALTWLKRKHLITLPCYGVLTDYTCIPFLEETKLDGYFIPHADLIKECADRGIAADKLFPTGIPVRSAFEQLINRREARMELSVPENRKLCLIMTGGMGCGNIRQLCDELLRQISIPHFSIIVLSGRNEALHNELCQAYTEDDRVQSVSFTPQVALYMKAADLLISKAGGISSTEAAVTGIPFIQTMTIPGCETKNAFFFAERGMSVRAENIEEAGRLACLLLNDETSANAMRTAQRSINSRAAADIVQIVHKKSRHAEKTIP